MSNDYRIALFSGSGIGLFLGLMMGLAVSPVVAVVIGALASSLAGILGLNDKHFSAAKGLRIGSLGFTAVLGVFLGMVIHTHNLLSPNLNKLKNKYVEIGYSEKEALDILAAERFNIFPLSNNNEIDNQLKARNRTASVLYSSEFDVSDCHQLSTPYDYELDGPSVLRNFSLVGGIWKSLASYTEALLDTGSYKSILFLVRDAVCGKQKLTLSFSEQSTLSSLDDSNSLAEITMALRNIDALNSLTTEVVEVFPQDKQKPALLVVSKTLSTEYLQ